MRTRSLVAAMLLLPLTVATTGPVASSSSTESPRRPRCTITGTNGEDHLHGTDGPDVICSRGGNDRVHAMGGDDVIVLGRGNDFFDAGPGDDRVLAGAGRDHGWGRGGDDRIFLQGGRDIAEDWNGVDLIAGGVGDDGMCVYDGQPNAPGDRVLGGPGPDYGGADTGDVVRSVKLVVYGGCWD